MSYAALNMMIFGMCRRIVRGINENLRLCAADFYFSSYYMSYVQKMRRKGSQYLNCYFETDKMNMCLHVRRMKKYVKSFLGCVYGTVKVV